MQCWFFNTSLENYLKNTYRRLLLTKTYVKKAKLINLDLEGLRGVSRQPLYG